MSDIVDNNKKAINLDDLTDEEVLDLEPEQVQALMEQEDNPEILEEKEITFDNNEDNKDEDENQEETSEISNDEKEITDNKDELDKEEDNTSEEISNKETEKETTEVSEIVEQKEEIKQEIKEEKETPSEDKNNKKEEVKTPELSAEQTKAMDFFTKITAPFKADGKDITIRSPEEAIRLIQMGTNYNRRMQEMKPMRAMASILERHDLNDPEKLSYLIDLKDGKPEAIHKLLKEHSIDPLDIDVSKDSSYQAPNYSSDPKDLAFVEAIENTVASEGGTEIINYINSSWDEKSKEILRESPEIFNKLLDQKRSGVYDKIVDELHHQLNTGHLIGVPTLQAHIQVGEAMEKAGVFNESTETQSGGLAPLANTPKSDPIDTGTRKAANKKNEQPNPNLSSNPNSASSKEVEIKNPDFTSMSDEDFLKLGIPE